MRPTFRCTLDHFGCSSFSPGRRGIKDSAQPGQGFGLLRGLRSGPHSAFCFVHANLQGGGVPLWEELSCMWHRNKKPRIVIEPSISLILTSFHNHDTLALQFTPSRRARNPSTSSSVFEATTCSSSLRVPHYRDTTAARDPAVQLFISLHTT